MPSTPLTYNPETGVLTGVHQWADKNGYLRCRVGRVAWLVHRLCYLLAYGWCPPVLDHKNRKPSDNRLSNLRPATHMQNSMNTQGHTDSAHQVKGLDWHKAGNTWRGRLRINGTPYTKRSKNREVVEAWLISKRAELCGEFTNH